MLFEFVFIGNITTNRTEMQNNVQNGKKTSA